MLASPLPSREPKRGQKRYVTPAFSGVPNNLGVQSYLGNGNLLKGPKCHFGEPVSQECAQKTNLKNV